MLLLAATEVHDGGTTANYPLREHVGLLRSLLGVVDRRRKDLNYPSIFQLQAIELYLRLLAPEVYKDIGLEPQTLLAKARKVSLAVDDYMQNSSRMHRRISQWFSRVGLHH